MRYATATRWAARSALLAALLAGAGCSWVRDATGWGEDDQANRPEPPGINRPYPNLATVPSRTPATGTTRERLQIEEGLLADRQNARHVNGPVAGLDRPSSLPPEPPARTTIIDPRARQAPPPGPRTAAAAPASPRLGPGGAIGSITYRAGSAALPEGSGRVIVRAAEFQRRQGGTIVIVGHAAKSEGDDAARRALAQQRATNIANGLLNLGVQRDQIRAVADGVRVDAPRVDIALTPKR